MAEPWRVRNDAGAKYEQFVAAITRLVDQVRGQAQLLLARATKPSLADQAQVIRTLASLLDDLPESLIDTILGSLPCVGTSTAGGGVTGSFGGLLGGVTGGWQNAMFGRR